MERSCCSSNPKRGRQKTLVTLHIQAKKATNGTSYTEKLTLKDTDTKRTCYIKRTDKPRCHTNTGTSENSAIHTKRHTQKRLAQKNRRKSLTLTSFKPTHSSHTQSAYCDLFPPSGRAILVCSQHGASLKRANNFFVNLLETGKNFYTDAHIQIRTNHTLTGPLVPLTPQQSVTYISTTTTTCYFATRSTCYYTLSLCIKFSHISPRLNTWILGHAFLDRCIIGFFANCNETERIVYKVLLAAGIVVFCFHSDPRINQAQRC